LRSAPSAPTDIDADSLEVNDPAKQAAFRGRVIAKQGDNVIQTAEMIAHYTGQTGIMSGGGDGQSKGVGGAQLTHLETKGGTKIVSKDGQEAEGANAHFDLKSNQATLDGPNGVVLKQGLSVINCARLKMDMNKGEFHCETGGQANAAPTAAQLSISAKPGVAPPAQPTGCPPGKMCAILHPDQFKQANDNAKKPGVAPPPPAPKPAVPVQPQISPSTVYRSN
jgi:lipopolysaccharide export system protein LptA